MNGDSAPAEKTTASTPAEILIRNERVKLTATWLNGLAVAIFAVGGFAPLIAATIASIPSDSYELHFAPPGVLVVIGVCWMASAGLHVLARRLLGNLIA